MEVGFGVLGMAVQKFGFGNDTNLLLAVTHAGNDFVLNENLPTKMAL